MAAQKYPSGYIEERRLHNPLSILCLLPQIPTPKRSVRFRPLWPTCRQVMVEAVWKLLRSGQQRRTFVILRELADSRMTVSGEGGARPLWRVDAALGLHEASPACSQFAGPTAVRRFDKFSGDDAIRPEMAEVLA